MALGKLEVSPIISRGPIQRSGIGTATATNRKANGFATGASSALIKANVRWIIYLLQ